MSGFDVSNNLVWQGLTLNKCAQCCSKRFSRMFHRVTSSCSGLVLADLADRHEKDPCRHGKENQISINETC
jgi:hypothetical protein